MSENKEGTKEKLYRYEYRLYSSGDDDYGYSTHGKLEVREFTVIKITRCGKWIQEFAGLSYASKPRFVLNRWANGNECHKRFAWENLEDAKKSFLLRKHRQLLLLKDKIRDTENAIIIAGSKLEAIQ